MERVKTILKDEAVKKVIREIERNAFGLPIIFESEPTNDTMKANTFGVYSGYLYIKFADNTTWKVQLTSVT